MDVPNETPGKVEDDNADAPTVSAGFITVNQQPALQQPTVPVEVVGVAVYEEDHTPGFIAWEQHNRWMAFYLAVSIVGVAISLWFTSFLLYGAILGVVTASLHVCTCCHGCYGEDQRRGASCIQVTALVSAGLALGFSILVVALDTSERHVPFFVGTYDIPIGIAIGCGCGYGLFSLVTAVMFGMVRRKFDPVTSGEVTL